MNGLKLRTGIAMVVTLWLWSSATGAQTLSWEVLDAPWSYWEPQDLASNGDQLVAVGLAGWIYSSSDDGRTWTQRSSGTDRDLRAVTWGDAGFVAAGDAVILYSSDGVSWIDTAPSYGHLWFDDVHWDGSLYLVGDYGRLLLSEDGLSWTPAANPLPDLSPLKMVSFRGGVLIAGHEPFPWGNGFPVFAYGTPEQGWTIEDAPELAEGIFSGLAASPSLALATVGWEAFYGGSDGPYAFSSGDGQQWLRHRPPTRLWGITYFDGRFFCAGENEHVVTSTTNGIVWEPELDLGLADMALSAIGVHGDTVIGLSQTLVVRGSRQPAAIPTLDRVGVALLMFGISAVGWALLRSATM